MSDLRKVALTEAQQKARQWGCEYMETSAKTRLNVNEAYMRFSHHPRSIIF